jgi:hypothetical protein
MIRHAPVKPALSHPEPVQLLSVTVIEAAFRTPLVALVAPAQAESACHPGA